MRGAEVGEGNPREFNFFKLRTSAFCPTSKIQDLFLADNDFFPSSCTDHRRGQPNIMVVPEKLINICTFVKANAIEHAWRDCSQIAILPFSKKSFGVPDLL